MNNFDIQIKENNDKNNLKLNSKLLGFCGITKKIIKIY
jgi:hypothetical protein